MLISRAVPAYALTLSVCLVLPGWAEQPLSAIDWLSQSVALPNDVPQASPFEPAVTKGVAKQDISVSLLEGPSPDAAGLLSASVTGLPKTLWGLGRTDEIVVLIRTERANTLPALQALLNTLMLAEADPPADSGGRGTLLLARTDALLGVGALDQAAALLDAAGMLGPELFRRRFDIALLTGTEDQGCVQMRENPQLAPTFPARIFCLARSGDWNAAALTLRTAQALGFVTPDEDALLTRFLDPELDDADFPLTRPVKPTPLVWRMLEAVGEPLPTNTLPLAFAQAELRDTAGWKSQIEAAERLARTGAVSPDRLLGFYMDRKPAASGGVWDRVAGVQALEAALTARDAQAVAQVLPVVWDRIVVAELEVPFAAIFAPRLTGIDLPPGISALAFRIALLSPDYETAAKSRSPADVTEAFLIGLAQGRPGSPAPDSLARAIAPAFSNPAPAADTQALLQDGRTGEAILLAVGQIGEGLHGNLSLVTQGLSLLRLAGLEDIARQGALQLMLLERRG